MPAKQVQRAQTSVDAPTAQMQHKQQVQSDCHQKVMSARATHQSGEHEMSRDVLRTCVQRHPKRPDVPCATEHRAVVRSIRTWRKAAACSVRSGTARLVVQLWGAPGRHWSGQRSAQRVPALDTMPTTAVNGSQSFGAVCPRSNRRTQLEWDSGERPCSSCAAHSKQCSRPHESVLVHRPQKAAD